MTDRFSANLPMRGPASLSSSAKRVSPRRISGGLLLLMLSSGIALAKSEQAAPVQSQPYSNVLIGFRYLPPSGLMDKTQRFRAEIQERAKASQAKNSLEALLAMSSGPDDASADWHSLTIETYPRNAVAGLDDGRAEAKMSAWVANSHEAQPVSRSVVISGQRFAVSIFGVQEGTIAKGAVVWTTIRKGKLLSFAFVANSPQQLKALAESMKTVQFF
jgi:hypothetical protein